MNAEHVMSGLAALRDKNALPDLFCMVVESLGGREALAESLGEDYVAALEWQSPEAGGDRAGADLDAMRDRDVARLENLQGMGESFCIWLHAKGAQQMQREDDRGGRHDPAAVGQLQQGGAGHAADHGAEA